MHTGTEWHIEDEVVGIATDNASNAMTAVAIEFYCVTISLTCLMVDWSWVPPVHH